MIGRKHHIQATDLLWLVSIIALVLSVIGVITLDGTQNHVLKTVSIIGLVLMGMLWGWHLFIQIPAEMFRDVKEESKDLLNLCSTQRIALLQKNIAPQNYLNIWVKRIILYKPKNDTPYASIELYVSNGTVFSLDYSVRCSQTKLNIDNASEYSLTINPTVEEACPDKLNQGCLNYTIQIKQVLTSAQLEELYSSNKHILARWKFEVKLKYKIEQEEVEQIYHPEWEGEHYKIQEIS
jgi:hypothetical protein